VRGSLRARRRGDAAAAAGPRGGAAPRAAGTLGREHNQDVWKPIDQPVIRPTLPIIHLVFPTFSESHFLSLLDASRQRQLEGWEQHQLGELGRYSNKRRASSRGSGTGRNWYVGCGCGRVTYFTLPPRSRGLRNATRRRAGRQARDEEP